MQFVGLMERKTNHCKTYLKSLVGQDGAERGWEEEEVGATKLPQNRPLWSRHWVFPKVKNIVLCKLKLFCLKDKQAKNSFPT